MRSRPVWGTSGCAVWDRGRYRAVVLGSDEQFETAEELLETASHWRDTEIPAGLAERVFAGSPPFTVLHDVRFRFLIRG